jgi:hypothetical protein
MLSRWHKIWEAVKDCLADGDEHRCSCEAADTQAQVGVRSSILEANGRAVLPVALKGNEVTHIEVAAMADATAILSTTRDETHHSRSGKLHSISASAIGTTLTESHKHHPLGRNPLPLLLIEA